MMIAFDLEKQRELIAALRRVAGAIDSELQALDETAAELRAGWSGAAQQAYDSAHAEWTASMASLRSALDAAASAGGDAGQALAHANRDAAKLWR